MENIFLIVTTKSSNSEFLFIQFRFSIHFHPSNSRFDEKRDKNLRQIADVYGFLVVFVLPLNAAVNPILYTFTTTKYRNQIWIKGWNKFASRKWHEGSAHTGSGSNHCNGQRKFPMKTLLGIQTSE